MNKRPLLKEHIVEADGRIIGEIQELEDGSYQVCRGLASAKFLTLDGAKLWATKELEAEKRDRLAQERGARALELGARAAALAGAVLVGGLLISIAVGLAY